MRYIIRQKIFSLGDSFTIKDEVGNDVFIVRSQLLSFGKKLRICDLLGNELCYIEQKLLRFLPEYDIYIGGQHALNIKKKFAMFRHDFDIRGTGAQYFVNGDFWAHEFGIVKDGRQVAQISKAFFSFSDTYGLDVDDGEDQISTLALAIVIDMVCHDENH
ncbi:MAG TPA: LURP-one-related family protein [Clostridia bacterium]|nr:LURP-one-related family protein [Clostridia bacterium]